jgi:pseudouridine-5'-phosphate glycosidase
MEINEEVKTALNEGKPVVSLESTIITHGMPYPENVTTALEVEEIVREQGAVPATIAIMDGRIKIGLTEDEIRSLGSSEDVYKTSIRDLPRVLSAGAAGGTTVAATAYAASDAGIRFFATGGIGGVHRGAAETYDVSADLNALAKCDICVVSAGVKSILDVPKTLEYLETLGVPVYGYETERFPGFYVRETESFVESVTKEELVRLLDTKKTLGLKHAVLVGVPVPEGSDLKSDFIDDTISEALSLANRSGITGKDVTPFLLSKIEEKTGGKSLETNIALIKNNAKTAAAVAAGYYRR